MPSARITKKNNEIKEQKYNKDKDKKKTIKTKNKTNKTKNKKNKNKNNNKKEQKRESFPSNLRDRDKITASGTASLNCLGE